MLMDSAISIHIYLSFKRLCVLYYPLSDCCIYFLVEYCVTIVCCSSVLSYNNYLNPLLVEESSFLKLIRSKLMTSSAIS